jgi:REP element-mobilizing transposase RayT
MRGRKAKQTAFQFRTWGGKRKNAGRKRVAGKPQVKHRTRAPLDGRTPVHVTLRVLPDVTRLRRRDQYRVVRQALARTAHKSDFRVCHFSVQSNHLHLICEPADARAMARGITGFKTSCARRLNGLVERKGAVFSDRYHARYLSSPAQVRRALCYVLNNWRRHREDGRSRRTTDPYSSADFFDGWVGHRPAQPSGLIGPEDTPPVADAAFWLLTAGWRRHGAIGPREMPGPKS